MSKVLLIDDDVAIQLLINSTLTRHGIEVTCADSAQAGIAAVADRVPDLILMDVGLPDGDGFALAERFRGEPALRDVPVIFLTGANTVADAEHGLDLGALDYVTKPFDFGDLYRRVRRALAAPNPTGPEKN
jgi:DNA-binding response OmpR family regulator